jgi:REP element-mobilizing transposase RayT
VTAPRQVIPGRTYFISRRCTQRQFLLRPDKQVDQIYLYCLGEAAQRYEVTLLGWVPMSNHQHIEARDNRGNLPAFLAHLNKMLAKALNAHWGRWENLWASEPPNVVYLVDANARFEKLIYLLANPVNDHLVERASDWPGATSLAQVLSGRSITVKRPRGFFSEDGSMPEEVTLRAERPEGFENLTQAEWSKLVSDAISAAERAARDERAKKKIRVLGRKNVLREKHTDRPSTVEPRKGLRPNIACKDRDGRIRALDALRAFRIEYRAMFKRWISRAKDVVFPAGTYRLLHFGVPCVPFGSVASAPS